MIYHSNTQKPLQGGRSRLGSRGIQGASGGEEAKEWSPEGPRPINCWVFIIVIIVFSDVTKPVMVFGRRWKFQTFVYNWLWGPQPNSEKLLPVIGLFPRLDTVQGLDSLIAKQGWQQAQLRLGAAPRVTQVFMLEEPWHGPTAHFVFVLMRSCHPEVDAELFRRTEWFLDILTLNYWNTEIQFFGLNIFSVGLLQDSLTSQNISL